MISVKKQNGSDIISNTGQVTETYEAEKKVKRFPIIGRLYCAN